MSYQQNYQQQGYGQPQYPAPPPQHTQEQPYPPPPQQHPQQQQSYAPPPQPSYGQQQSYQPQAPPTQGYGMQQFQQPLQQTAPPEVSDSGSYQGLSWVIKHRNTNSTLNVTLGQSETIKVKPGAMIHMSPQVTLKGEIKVSMKKLFTGGQMATAMYTGPGTVALAPTLFGDIVTINIEQDRVWNVGKDAFLACTSGVSKDTKSQGLGKAFFSGEDLFVYKVSGQGVAWLTSYGAVEAKHLQAGEQHIVDNGHLVAWNCDYKIEKAGGGSSSSIKTGEGLVCRFTGPGTIYIQTRNLDDFADWVRSKTSSNSS